jgi:hypothetical protein
MLLNTNAPASFRSALPVDASFSDTTSLQAWESLTQSSLKSCVVRDPPVRTMANIRL